MSDKKAVLVLGGVTNHKILLNKLKKRGFYTILVDYLDEPPAKMAADEHVQVSTFDLETVEKLAIERNVSLIINACIEHVNVVICKIAEKLGLPHPYSYETALDISNKERMKAKMAAGGIPTTPYICVSKPDGLEGMKLRFPVYVKPADGSGSNGVSRAESLEEAKRCVEKAAKMSRGAKIIVEEEALGAEYSVYCFPQDGKANVLMIVRRYTDNYSEDKVTKCIATFGPAILPDTVQNKISRVADQIVQTFELDNTPMFMQVMICGDQVNVIEFAGRMAGGFSYQTIYENTGFDLFEATINAFLRVPNKMEYDVPKQYMTVTTVYASGCVFDRVDGYEKLLEEGILSDIMLPRISGTLIEEGRANGNRVAFLIHRGDTVDDLMEKIRKTFENIEVYDVDGNPRMKRGVYLTKERL